jgi:hypothetical protein
VSPILSRGRLVGFIDMRDKAGKKPFDAPDVEAAKRIADEMLGVLASNKLFGVGPITIHEEPAAHAAPALPNLVRPSAPLPQNTQTVTPSAVQVIDAARQYMARRQLTVQTSGRRSVTEADLELLRLLLPSALAISGVVLAAISGAGLATNPHTAAALASVHDDALETLQLHLQAWLKRANQPHMTVRPQVVYPLGSQPVPIAAAGLTTILTAPVVPQSIDGLLLTVAFERTQEATAQRALQTFLRQIEPSIETALTTISGRGDRMLIAERLLEPDFQKFPDLAEHCREVAALAHRFARILELPAAQAETVRIAAYVHDVGLRLLDYDRMYRRASLTSDEMRVLAEHPVVGAALVEPLLGSEVAQAVLRHHERVDGKGYPSRLSGQQIPVAARILQIADAWVAMTARGTYQAPIPREVAAARLREGSGTQFDPALIDRFLARLPEITG